MSGRIVAVVLQLLLGLALGVLGVWVAYTDARQGGLLLGLPVCMCGGWLLGTAWADLTT